MVKNISMAPSIKILKFPVKLKSHSHTDKIVNKKSVSAAIRFYNRSGL